MTGTADLGANIASLSCTWSRSKWRGLGFRFIARAGKGRNLRRRTSAAKKGGASDGATGSRCAEPEFPWFGPAQRSQIFRNAILYRGLYPQELAKYASSGDFWSVV